MPFKKGDKPVSGRQKGTPNRSTVNAREAIARFVDAHAGLLEDLLTEIRQKDGPKATWQCIVDLLEFHVPKLARTEVTGKDGGPIQYSPPVVELHPGQKP